MVHKSCKTISAALAYDCPDTGEVLILIVNQAIYIPSLTHNLLCPMQLWMNDVQVSDQPKFLTDNPDNKTHALVLKDQDDEDFVIPLDLCGVTSYFPTRTPTSDEYASCRRFDLTSPDPPWDPQDDSFARMKCRPERPSNDRFPPFAQGDPMTLSRLCFLIRDRRKPHASRLLCKHAWRLFPLHKLPLLEKLSMPRLWHVDGDVDWNVQRIPFE